MFEEPKLPFFSKPEMDRVFSISSQLRQMIRFEWALSAALESAGLARAGAAAAIEALRDGHFVDMTALLMQAEKSGNLAIPLIRQLTSSVRSQNENAALFVHRGATSQDVLDTALVLQIREALGLIETSLQELDECLASQARKHADTVLAGRTWLQAGPPVTLGLKIAGWLAALRRHRQRVASVGQRAAMLQFGGAVGTLAALGEKGTEVSSTLARKLELREPEIPWHTHRDNLVEVATTLGLLVGTLGKIARDVSLLMQTEVAEVFESAEEGRGGSSTMPHKRNPVGCAVILAVANRVPALVSTLLSSMGHEHERGLGNWQAEWETYPEIFRLTASALDRTREIARGMEVNQEKMRANLEASDGLVMSEAVSVALADRIGRDRAHDLIEKASRRAIADKRHLGAIMKSDQEICKHLTESQIDNLMDPRNYLGSARKMIDRVLGEPDAAR
jgi:3-carboxy-cis,cis-muconate cycloisomerase